MRVSSFYNTSALPYYFQLSNSLTNGLHGDVIAQTNSASKAKSVSKANAVSTTSAAPSGRGRGVAAGGFYYSVGNLNVDGNLIDFVGANYKANYNNLTVLNNVLLSQPFTINSNSVLSFSENSGAADTVAAAGLLASQGYLTFTVQLIDNVSGSVLGTVRQVNFSSVKSSEIQDISIFSAYNRSWRKNRKTEDNRWNKSQQSPIGVGRTICRPHCKRYGSSQYFSDAADIGVRSRSWQLSKPVQPKHKYPLSAN